MSIHYQRALELLRKRLLAEGARVEDMLSRALRALLQRDPDLAQETMDLENGIDQDEIEVEEECLKILALYQPVAQDLRFIVSVLKMNNDLEGVSDVAANIAKRARWLARRDPLPWPDEFESLAQNVRTMLRQSLDSLISSDAKLAREVCRADDIVDAQKRQVVSEIRSRMHQDPAMIDVLLKMMDVPRHLERIADLAANIAEDVAYMVDGQIIRHRLHDEEQMDPSAGD